MNAKQTDSAMDCGVRKGQALEGFHIDEVTPLPDLRATAIRATHRKSGARLLHLFTVSDTENCFAVTFPTPPPDDTGVPHILEHAVLGGSEKFPVREPFFEMVKMSMATFINAMTSQAFTVYPVASNVKKDFFNLAEVYLDAVFHPVLTEDIFRREGHHFTLENNADPASPLKLSGVVYSEMKGLSSTPEQLMDRLAEGGLFPDTPLGRDSGGDPDRIPELTFEQFRSFHREKYHPGNALFFIYGDIPIAEHLRFLAPVLNGFTGRRAEVAVPRQPRWDRPRRIEKDYPIGADEDASARAFLTLNWLVGDALDPAQVENWKILSELLLGNEAAPLRKALIDSKLGDDVFFAGASENAYEATFHAGLKGSDASRADAFERLVLDTLARIAGEPFAPGHVEAAFHQIAYETLEVGKLFPLSLLFAANQAWPYNGDPLTFLREREHLEACHARYAADPLLFNSLIRDGLLNNPHRLLVILRPDREAQARADAAFAARMAEQRARLDPAQIAGIARSATALAAAQGVPNPPEALAKLPQLKTSDLPPRPRRIPTETGQIAGMTVLRNDVFSNGVNYMAFDVDLAGLPPELYQWLPRFDEVIAKMGAAGQDFSRIAERRTACTGGLWSSPDIFRHASDPACTLRRYRFGLKTLDAQAEGALALLGDLVFSADPGDRGRLRDVITQVRAAYRTKLVNDGRGTAVRQAARGLNAASAINHLFMSPDALGLIEEMAGNFDERAGEIIRNVERIRDFILASGRWTISFTGSDAAFGALSRTLEDWGARMRHEQPADAMPAFRHFSEPPREALAGPMLIAHCAKAMPAPHLAHPDTPLLNLGLYLANFDYMLPEIRLKGNAYGASVRYASSLDAIVLSSYFDPHIVETLDVFDGLRGHIAAQHWSQTDIDRAIIGSAKAGEAPIRPAEATDLAMTRRLSGDTDELRDARYAAALRANPASVKETTLRVLAENEPRAAVCVVSSRENLEKANDRLGEKRLAISNILA